MKKLLECLHDALTQGEDVVLVTIVASSGSTPRGAGARMLVSRRGRLCGTIGGGMVEYRGEQIAQDVLQSKGSKSHNFKLYKNEVADLGMICGGDVDVYFHYIPAGSQSMIFLVEKALELFSNYEQSWIITEITPELGGNLRLYGKKTGLVGEELPPEVLNSLSVRPVQCRCGGRVFYCERLVQSGRVYIFGGGHISQALTPLLSAVGFSCIVIEDRAEFARHELFACECETRLVEIDKLQSLASEISEDDYICVMTRGHKDDLTVQREMLKSKACYIGVIGSRKKSAAVFEKLMEYGYTGEDLKRITTPIGLSIGAETPSEIAVSIAAQLIKFRAERTGGKAL